MRRNAILILVAMVASGPWAIAQKAAPPKPLTKAKQPAPDAKSVETLTASALPSVVVIKHFGRDGKEDGVGAGFVISTDGLIATSLHVIGEARPIAVQFADGTQREVTEVYAWDRKFDLAIIRVAATKLPALTLGDSDALKQGAAVMAIGNPVGLRHSVVQGVLSARRDVDGNEMFQVAIPIEPGNSGGPLLDMKGRVHGVLTLKSALTANLGFAMPSKLITALLEKPNPVPMSRWLTIGALNARDWKPVFGARWSQRAGRVQVEGAGQGFGGRSLCLSQKPVPARPYEIAVEVRLDDESGAAGLVFAADGGDRHYGFYPSAGQLRLTRFDGPSVYSWNILKQVPTEHYQPGEWNQIRVRVEAERILCFVNDQLVAESQDDGLKEGQVGLAKFRDTRAEFRNFRLGTNGMAAAGRDASATGTNVSALKERARALEREAKELRREAARLHRETVQRELLKVMGQPEAKIDLFHATLLLARLDNAELDIEPYRQQLVEMAREVSGKFAKDAEPGVKLGALKEYLFAENGFHGSRSDYSSRANSYMNQVLDDREGLPITLSVLFIELAQRIGLSGVDGLPLPGHFMVRYAPGNGPEQIIDAYNGGRTVSRTEAQERVLEATGEGFRDFDYRSATKREIILRMLRNLLGGIRVDDAPVDSLRYLDVILALAPDGVGDRLNRARVRMQMGNSAGAKEDFKWLLDQQPAGVDLERIAELYRSL